MSHINEKGMVVGKRYMLTYKAKTLTQIIILKYYEFTDRDIDIYHIEHLLNTKTGELKENFEFETPGPWNFLNIIDMEEIDLEYSKIKLAFARCLLTDENSLYSLSHDLIDSIGEKLKELYKELYFEICLKIYNRLIGRSRPRARARRPSPHPLARAREPSPRPRARARRPIPRPIPRPRARARRPHRSQKNEFRVPQDSQVPYEERGGGGKKRKSKKRKSNKKKKSKTRRRRR